MSLKVIGTGFGRTGSHSLKLALEMLGLGPCYHMMEVFSHPGHAAIWDALGRSVRDSGSDQKKSERSDFVAALGGFPATVDWPTTYFWRSLVAQNPAAKILHTERPAEEWYQSISQTIFPALSRGLPPEAPEPMPGYRAQNMMARKLIVQDTFGGDLSKENAIKVYDAHNAAVRARHPHRARSWLFNARDGWEPLCRFLGVPMPAAEFPRTNSTDEFRARANLD